MRVLLYLGILLFVSPYLPLFEKLQAAEFSGKTMSGKQEYSGFIVNNGQLIDQKGRPNPQVLYLLNDHGFNVQLRKSGFSYDLYFIKPVPNPYFLKLPENNSLHSTRHSDSLIPEYHFMRIDIDLVNANPSPIIETSGPLSGYLNYYTSGTPDEGITTVMSYTTILCKNIYPGIDLQFLGSEEAGFEYNFIIHPGGRVSSIRLKAEGPDHINMNGDGIRCKTSMGDLDETVPHCYYRLNDKNVRVNGRFKKLSGHVYGFALDQPVPETALIIIDPVPVRRWGTYYGGTGWESSLSRCCVTDSSGNIFISGTTHSANNIATAGAHQSVYSGNGDAFLVKFLSTGQRLWGTYYGGNASTDGAGCAADPEGNSYLVGRTHATNNIATAGAYQTIKRGGIDAFVAKFTPSGVRLWGTYYGGNETGNPAADEFEDCSADNVGNIYCSGLTTAPDYVATPGAHQTILGGTCDATLIKFSVDGQCLWGTYYGGANQEGSSGSSISESGFIYLSGTTGSPDNIATPGSFMPVYTGGSKVFLACFDLAGTRLWGTYFGGEADDYYSGCVSDSSGNVYLFGGTGSNTNIATPGAFLMNRANGSSYLEKFDITGARIWGTYYPGELRGAAIDDSGFVFLAGYNFLPNPLVSTPDAYQSFPRSIGEAFLGKMNGNGQRIWGTYYGGTTTDQGACCAVDRNDNLYLYGNTYSTNNTVNNTSPCSRNRNANYIATPGAHQPELSVAADAFLVKFTDCYSPDTALQVFGPSALCLNSTGIVFSIAPITYAADYHWCVTGDLTITSGQGTTAISVDVGSSLGVDTISIYGINACDTGFPRVIVRTVFPRPVPFLSGPDSICSGVHAVYLTSGGQSSYVWTISPGYTLVSGGGSGDSSCTVTWNNSGFRWIRVNYSDTHGCDALVPAQFSTWVTDSPAVNIGVMASANPVCAGTSVTFTATPTNGGTIPIFQWLVNGMGGLPSAPTMSYTPVNGDCITCILTSNLVCAHGISGQPGHTAAISMEGKRGGGRNK
ncbi:MAG: SBBP repeat-containing protein [Bacteroidetes bacterium]|nr:SBBP repeat-containing protein [Bacteroidota bacterium]